jgi:phospholipid/cholesterol/gamma-HCH transport system substrate-binding protein
MKWTNETRVGFVVFAAAIIFVVGVIVLRGIDLRSKQYSLTVLYRSVTGLKAGDMVTVSGLVVGSVESMTFAGREIRVDLSIQTKVRLPKDSRAVVKSETIMGGKFIEITPGADTLMLRDGDSLFGMYEADLSELTSTLAPISSNVLGILENVNNTFDEPTRRRVQGVVIELERAAKRLDETIQNSGPRADQVMADLSTFARDLSSFARTLDSIAVGQGDKIDASMTSLQKTSSNLSRVSAKLENTADLMNEVLTKIRNGEGTLGKLVQKDKLYNDLDSLAVNLTKLVVDIRENPNKYVKVSVF